ncbi:DUF3500 domain-containing protein [Portibacter marinus]|uniref:DUF3500 domain-containing protein n=1 Tax=Portibacter marinus TaxID=2898660 RepID=UPI001F34DA2B|nr:DUF3500 domain-containing protein [Portibacter marinus]
MRYLIAAIIAFSSYHLLTPSQEPTIAFINSLSTDQKSKAIFTVDHERRTDWHYLPAGSYERPGIKLADLKQHQREKVFDILRSVLSEKGLEKSKAIIDLENVLAELENNYTHRDPDQYSIAIFGHPSNQNPWSWSFSGHHLSLHFTYADGQISATPRFFGANPATVLEGPKKGLRVLAKEEDLGMLLLHSLDEDQKEIAIISEEPYWEILTKNDSKVDPLQRQGIGIKQLTGDQRKLLLKVLAEYLSSLKPTLAEDRMKIIQNEDLIFAWAGSTALGKPYYYRIQGESFLIEFDNAQNGANHIHTVWRDFDGDFGQDLLLEHRKKHKH